MTPLLKTYLVRFCVRDCYSIELKARDADAALEKAEALYEQAGEDAFQFDLSDGGTDDWDVEEVAS